MERVLGIVGGTGPESTIDYYRSIIRLYRRRGDGEYPRILINSVEASGLLRRIASGDTGSVADDVLTAVRQLAGGGAGAALLASNTVHLVFDRVAGESPIPLLSIVDATAEEAKGRGISRAGLLGLRFLVEAPLYGDRLAHEGVHLVLPSDDEQEYIDNVYVHELVNGVLLDATRGKIERIIMAMRDRHRIDAVILAGTELSLLVTETSSIGIPVLHTAQIHVQRAVDWLLRDGSAGSDPRIVSVPRR